MDPCSVVAVASQLLALQSNADSSCKMKCAAIALALQGATGLVAPRLTVKSSALNAATLEVANQCCKISRALAPPPPQASPQRHRCTNSPAEQQSLAKNASHTHIRRGERRRTSGCKTPREHPSSPYVATRHTTHSYDYRSPRPRPRPSRPPPTRRAAWRWTRSPRPSPATSACRSAPPRWARSSSASP